MSVCSFMHAHEFLPRCAVTHFPGPLTCKLVSSTTNKEASLTFNEPGFIPAVFVYKLGKKITISIDVFFHGPT